MTPLYGTATLQQQGAKTTVTTTNGTGSRHSAIDWRSFSVPAANGVFFSQPDAASTSINRVLGGNPSAIFGTLGSNGKLVLVNPAGIAVGAGAVVDTAGFTASTLPMSRADAIAGRLNFGTGDTSTPGAAVRVDGEVLARNGDVVLIGPRVETGAQAVVRAQDGDVILGAGRKAYITGRGFEGIRFEVRAPSDRAMNLGRLQGDSVAIFASLLQHSGAIQAGGSAAGSGKVVLQAAAQAQVSGSIQAAAPGQGGSVHVTAERLLLKAATSIDVSHRAGGGEILLGGGWQGKDARITNALAVDVEAGVQLRADATFSGPGGTIVVWSDDRTRFAGVISARGAGPAGAGGRAEVSGRRQLIFRGTADLGAENGQTGQLLLDPDTVTIRGGSGSTRGDDDDDDDDEGGSSAVTLYESALEGMNANISIQANRKIQASGPFGGGELLVAPNRNLKMELVSGGSGGILLQGMPIRTQGSGSVELRTAASGQPIEPDRITTAGGSITLAAANSDIRLRQDLASAGGAVTLRADRIDFQGSHTFAPGTSVAIQSPTVINEGVITLSAGAHMTTGGTKFENKSGSVLAGTGHLDLAGAKLDNDGTLRPGGAGAIGDLRITGEVEQKSSSRMEIEVAGPNFYDRVLVSGAVKLDGTLALTAIGYTPAAGDSYAFAQARSVSSSFDTVQKPAFSGFTVDRQGTRVLLTGPGTAAPAPAPADDKKAVDDKKADDDRKLAKAEEDRKAAAADGKKSDEKKADLEVKSTARFEPVREARSQANAQQAELPFVPVAEQPVPVQVAMQEPTASTDSFLQRSAHLSAQPSGDEKEEAVRRRIRITAIQCRTD